MKKQTIAILGAGSWGTAMAIHLAALNHPVMLWGRDPQHITAMLTHGCNTRYLPQIPFPLHLTPSASLTDCLTQADQTIIAVPSHAFADLLNHLPKPTQGLAWLTKGVDPRSHHLLSQLVADKWGVDYPVVVISGPSFAREVAEHLPTALVLAGQEERYLHTMRDLLHHNNLRTYLTNDIIGVQLCGAIKNVLAIACGISDGLHYGANARAALITRGLAEMSRLGLRLGAKPETFMGLAGLGDLVLTCTDDQSRNRRFGLLLGRDSPVSTAEKQIGQVVEGKHNAAQVCHIATECHVEMPICEKIHALLQGQISAQQVARQLMSRPPSREYNSGN